MTIDQMSQALKSVGACFAVTSAKTVLPNESRPSYHIHPDDGDPRQDSIECVYSQAQFKDWVRTAKAAKRATNPDDASQLWFEYQNRWQ